jgi:hypothetical protein
VACPATAWERALRQLAPVGLARAGHGDDTDVSIAGALVEPLHAPATGRLSGVRGERPYCQLHYLVARADDETVTGPEAAWMGRLSLVLAGSWRAPGDAAWVPLELVSDAGYGRLEPLSALVTEGPEAAPSAVGRSAVSQARMSLALPGGGSDTQGP